MFTVTEKMLKAKRDLKAMKIKLASDIYNARKITPVKPATVIDKTPAAVKVATTPKKWGRAITTPPTE